VRGRAFILLVGLAVTGDKALGCSARSYELVPVQADFTVDVSHHGAAIAGASVRLTKQGADIAVFDAMTDESGIVKISSLPQGQYNLVVSYKDIEAGREWIGVGRSPKEARSSFNFEWAEGSEEVKRIAGRLTGLEKGTTGHPLQDLIHPQEVPEKGVEISLQDALSDAKYDAISDSNGEFWFDALPAGTYILAIGGGAKSISGTVAEVTTYVVDLSPSAPADFLPLRLQDGGCGGATYELQTKR
jgi:hypothetical protein